MKIRVATYQLHFFSFVTKASHYSDFKSQKQTNKQKISGKDLEDVITWIMIPTMDSWRGEVACIMLLMNGIMKYGKYFLTFFTAEWSANEGHSWNQNDG